jgi:methyl-accepting chemotaxis protein
MIGAIVQGAAALSGSAQALTGISQRVAEDSRRQSEAAVTMAAAIEEMTVSVDHVATHTREAQALANQAGDLSKGGTAVIHNATEEMGKIAGAVQAASQVIQTLEGHSQEISAVIGVIRGVADQTNLLALNAAIEAARAGDQGRGFAVVADEVRKLAERTAQSTREISHTITRIHDNTHLAVASMARVVEQAKEGVVLAGQAGDSINQIWDGASQVTRVVTEISTALREQSVASNEIARNVDHIAHSSSANSTAAGEAARAAAHVEELATSIKGLVGRFRV